MWDITLIELFEGDMFKVVAVCVLVSLLGERLPRKR